MKEQLEEYFKVRRQADTLFTPIIKRAWEVGWQLLGNERGFRLKIGPLVGSHGVQFFYRNDFTKKEFTKETPTSILYDESVLEEEKRLVGEIVKSLR